MDWISVDEQLPDNHLPVLCYGMLYDKWEVFAGSYDSHLGWWCFPMWWDARREDPLSVVSYWMLFPTAPCKECKKCEECEECKERYCECRCDMDADGIQLYGNVVDGKLIIVGECGNCSNKT